MNNIYKTVLAAAVAAIGSVQVQAQAIGLNSLPNAPQVSNVPQKYSHKTSRISGTINTEQLVDEDFSKLTEGSEESPGTEPIQDSDYTIDSKYTKYIGWTGFGLFQAGGAMAINYPGYGGFINSPEMYMKGLVTVTFRAKALADINAFRVCLNKNGIGSPQLISCTDVKIKKEYGWKTFKFSFYNPYEDDAFVQINYINYSKDKKGILIDDINIELTTNYVPATTSISNSSFKNDGFTSSWSPIEGADKYLVSLYKETTTGNSDEQRTLDFNDITVNGDNTVGNVPEGWTLNMDPSHSPIAAGMGDNGSAALMLADESEYVATPTNGGRIKNIVMWVKLVKGDNPKAGSSQYEIQGWDGNSWQSFFAFNTSGWEDGASYTLNLAEHLNKQNNGLPESQQTHFAGLYTRLRIKPVSMNYGVQLAIDDINVEYEPATTTECIKSDIETADCSMTFSGIEMAGHRYYVGVKSESDGFVSDEYKAEAFGVSAPVASEATDITADSYTANWTETPNAVAYLVTNYNCFTASAPIVGYQVLGESFDRVSGTSADPEKPTKLGNTDKMISLDEYTQRQGWTGGGNTIVNGAIGCQSSRIMPGMYAIISPLFTLGNNDGKFVVKMRAWTSAGDRICIVPNSMERFYSPEFEDTGWKDFTVELSGGMKHDQLGFYTANGSPFLIDNIEVTQDMQPGDNVLVATAEQEVYDKASATFDNIATPDGMTAAYDVMAAREYYSMHAVSDYSNTIVVNMTTTGIGQLGDKATTVTANGRHITVTNTSNGDIAISDVTGRTIACLRNVSGCHDFVMPYPGVFIVKSGNTKRKIVAE